MESTSSPVRPPRDPIGLDARLRRRRAEQRRQTRLLTDLDDDRAQPLLAREQPERARERRLADAALAGHD